MEPLARGKVDKAFKVKAKHLVQVRTKRPVDFFNMRLALTPGGHTGWHSHPGPVLVSVRSGSVISYDADCSSHTYRAGQGFVDPGHHVHIMRNPGSATAELYVTAILPAGVPLRTDEPAAANCF